MFYEQFSESWEPGVCFSLSTGDAVHGSERLSELSMLGKVSLMLDPRQRCTKVRGPLIPQYRVKYLDLNQFNPVWACPQNMCNNDSDIMIETTSVFAGEEARKGSPLTIDKVMLRHKPAWENQW